MHDPLQFGKKAWKLWLLEIFYLHEDKDFFIHCFKIKVLDEDHCSSHYIEVPEVHLTSGWQIRYSRVVRHFSTCIGYATTTYKSWEFHCWNLRNLEHTVYLFLGIGLKLGLKIRVGKSLPVIHVFVMSFKSVRTLYSKKIRFRQVSLIFWYMY